MYRFFLIIVFAYALAYCANSCEPSIQISKTTAQGYYEAIPIQPLLDFPREPNVEDKEEFINRILEVSSNLDLNPQWLVHIMDLECNLDPTQVNRVSGASGLIQLTNTALREMNRRYRTSYTLYQVRKMTAVQQMDLVEKYL